MSSTGWEQYHQVRNEAGYPMRQLRQSRSQRRTPGGDGFSSSDNDAPASSTHPGQGQRQLRDPASAVPASHLMQVMAMLEGIRDYGQAHAWAALGID